MTGPLTLIMAFSLGAPVPKLPPPDPLAWGYLGVKVPQGTMTLSSVEPDGPAIKAGLLADDEIVALGTLTKPKSFDEVAEHIASFRPGSQMKVTVRRNNEEKSFVVTLGVRPVELGPPPNRSRVAPQIIP